jgi:hypothetical protein
MNPLKWNMNVTKILFVIFRVHVNLFLKDISISVNLPAQKKPFFYEPISKSIYQNNSVMPAKAGIQNYMK